MEPANTHEDVNGSAGGHRGCPRGTERLLTGKDEVLLRVRVARGEEQAALGELELGERPLESVLPRFREAAERHPDGKSEHGLTLTGGSWVATWARSFASRAALSESCTAWRDMVERRTRKTEGGAAPGGEVVATGGVCVGGRGLVVVDGQQRDEDEVEVEGDERGGDAAGSLTPTDPQPPSPHAPSRALSPQA